MYIRKKDVLFVLDLRGDRLELRVGVQCPRLSVPNRSYGTVRTGHVDSSNKKKGDRDIKAYDRLF